MKAFNGNETFYYEPEQPVAQVTDFWRWQGSDLLNNTLRGVLSEFIVATALGIDLTKHRVDWEAYDLLYNTKWRIEVKSSAYIQSWEQKKPSSPLFSIRPAREWANDTGFGETSQRNSDLYVFCLFSETERENADPLNLKLWDFWVLSTANINLTFCEQKTVALGMIKSIAVQTKYDGLKSAVDLVVANL
jgi:hypothetical protein